MSTLQNRHMNIELMHSSLAICNHFTGILLELEMNVIKRKEERKNSSSLVQTLFSPNFFL